MYSSSAVAFFRGVLGPLLDLPPPAQTLMVVVDALDVGHGPRDGCDKSGSVAKLLAVSQHLLPSWLLLVCSVRRQNKAVCKMFSGTNVGQLLLMQFSQITMRLLRIACVKIISQKTK